MRVGEGAGRQHVGGASGACGKAGLGRRRPVGALSALSGRSRFPGKSAGAEGIPTADAGEGAHDVRRDFPCLQARRGEQSWRRLPGFGHAIRRKHVHLGLALLQQDPRSLRPRQGDRLRYPRNLRRRSRHDRRCRHSGSGGADGRVGYDLRRLRARPGPQLRRFGEAAGRCRLRRALHRLRCRTQKPVRLGTDVRAYGPDPPAKRRCATRSMAAGGREPEGKSRLMPPSAASSSPSSRSTVSRRTSSIRSIRASDSSRTSAWTTSDSFSTRSI